MGTTRACARKPVRTSAWTESPGLMSGGGSLIWIFTRNLMAWEAAPVAARIGLFPTSVTTPVNVRFG